MLVSERMTHPVITVSPKTSIADALNMMRHAHIHIAPVIRDGKMIGIISQGDLLHASPSDATSLNIWELNYLLSRITVDQVMTRDVISVTEDTPMEEAARIMADNKIGGMPVMRDGHIVGMITETDLFKIFLELMGARETGVRVTALIPYQIGQLARLTQAIAQAGGIFIALGMFAGEDPANRLVMCKVAGLELEQVRELLTPVVEELIDIRLARP